MASYAANTEVSAERSRSEIERTLTRWGAKQFMYGWSGDAAVVGFVLRNRQIRFVVTMPDRDSKEFRFSNHTPPRRRTAKGAQQAYEQACRQRWRALNLVIKAKLEAVESGIATFDNEFLAQMVLPNGQTVGEYVTPELTRSIESHQMPELLPDLKAIEP
jgi:hypothetical protein